MTAAPLEGEILGPDVETLRCDECGETVTGPRGGKGSASWQLSRHRWNVHKIRKDGSRDSGKRQPAPDAGPTSILTVVADAGAGVKGAGPPRADQLGKALGKILATVTESAAGWTVKSDPAIRAALDPATPGNTPEGVEFAQRQAALIAASLSLSDATAARVTAPLARLLAPTRLNQRFGRAVVENTDLGPAVAELVEFGQAWAGFLAVRREHVRELKRANHLSAQQLAAQQAAGFDPGAPMPPPPAPTPDAPGGGPGPLGSGVVALPTYL